MLKVTNLNLFYNSIHALKDISLEINQGEVVTLIGANGAGKTSTLRALSRLENIKSGEITFKGSNINNASPNTLPKLGLVHVPEGRKIFANMTVAENLDLGAYTRSDKKEIKEDYEKILTIFPRLKERRKQLGGTLSGGEQQMLAIGRAMMTKPQLLLLDEPSMGLAPIIVQEIFNIIKEINSLGTTVLLVEQNAHMALSIAHRAYVLETGKIVLEGAASDLLNDEKVKAAYLGE
jgi:branched-chain amino acid transport system ATP-binding protein